MNKLIKLHAENGNRDVYVNLANVCTIEQLDEHITLLRLSNSDVIHVKKPVAKVLQDFSLE